MYQTNYVKAASTDEAVGHMSSGGQLLAGGMTLIPTMKQRLASPETVVDLAGCGLSGIEDTGDAIRIGAMTDRAVRLVTHLDVDRRGVTEAGDAIAEVLTGS